MENATKALIMAGGILLALIILAAFTYLMGQMSITAKEQDRVKLLEQVSEFNKQYEAYERNLLRGVDIASVCNKANSNNMINERKEIEEEIRVYVTFIQDWDDKAKDIKHDMTEFNFDNLKKNESDKFYTFKTKYFKCEKMEYNEDTAKVTALYFTEIDGKALLGGEE